MLKELLGLPDATRRLARLAGLRQRPGGAGDGPGELNGHISGTRRCDPVLDPRAGLGPLALEEVTRARSELGPGDGERMLRGLGQSRRLRLVLGRFGESA